jgi:glycosyltransferase involved in cell wall biosynthesis
MKSGSTKVCIVGPSKHFFSGPAIRTIYLANALSKRNQVSALLFKNIMPKFMYPGSDHVGKNISSLDFDSSIKVHDGLSYCSPMSWYRGYRFLRETEPDVVIMLWWSATVAHMELLIKDMLNHRPPCRLIMEMHEITDPLENTVLPIRLYSRIMGRKLLKNIETYVTLSEHDRQLFSSHFGIDAKKVFVVPLGEYNHYGSLVDKAEAKKKLGIAASFTIGYFGLIREYKGVPNLIEALDSLPDDIARNCHLLIVGEIWEKEVELRDRINSSKYKQKITLVPQYVPDQEIPIYLSAMDVVVLPYLRPVSSGVVQIMKAYDKAIITSDFGPSTISQR